MPFIVGLGCSVPAIMSTRIIKDSRERDLSIMLTPFIPCSAKLPIIALFAGGILFGVIGVFISFPLAIIIVTTYKFYKEEITRNIKKITNND